MTLIIPTSRGYRRRAYGLPSAFTVDYLIVVRTRQALSGGSKELWKAERVGGEETLLRDRETRRTGNGTGEGTEDPPVESAVTRGRQNSRITSRRKPPPPPLSTKTNRRFSLNQFAPTPGPDFVVRADRSRDLDSVAR